MADVEAPLAQLENEEWQDFNDLRILTGLNFCREDVDGFRVDNGGITDGCGGNRLPSLPLLLDNSCSLGDNISKCFRIDTTNRADEAPTILQSQNEVLVNNQIWHQISESFDNALPVQWSQSYAHQLQENSLNLQEKMGVGEVIHGLDMSDDEELHQAMDLHCLILSSQDDEPILTADEVISEIEEMMEQEDLDCTETYVSVDGPSKTAQLIRNKLKQAVTPGSTVKDCLQKMTSSDLYTLHEELDCTIREFSEVLVHELASREELEFQKELNNQFISLILSIQKKRREMETEKKKAGGKMPPAKTKEYLTTVIPYDHHQGTPDADRLQIYIKILTAINEDNSTVPLLLTDYILNVLCPKT